MGAALYGKKISGDGKWFSTKRPRKRQPLTGV